MDSQTSLINEFIAAANRRLKTALAAIGVKSYDDSVSRSFYAFLDIATAALIFKGEHPRSHSGVISKFSENYLKNNIFDPQYGQWFNRIRRDREQADYRHLKKFTKEEAEEALKAAKIFVQTIEKFIKSNIKK